MYAEIQKQLQKRRTLSLFILFVYHLSDVLASLATTHLMVTHVGPCGDGPKGLLTVDELSITTQTYDSSITGVFNITEDVDDGWYVTGTMQKCQDIRNIDTCDHYATFHVVSDGCRDDEAEEIYSMFFHYVTPELECPIRAGNYKLTNYPLFSEHNYLTVSEAKISTSVFGYTFQLDGFTVNKKRFFCIEAYLQLMYVREHDWLGPQQTDKPSRTTATTAAPKINDDDEDEDE